MFSLICFPTNVKVIIVDQSVPCRHVVWLITSGFRGKIGFHRNQTDRFQITNDEGKHPMVPLDPETPTVFFGIWQI